MEALASRRTQPSMGSPRDASRSGKTIRGGAIYWTHSSSLKGR
jgi:hypothetical protein